MKKVLEILAGYPTLGLIVAAGALAVFLEFWDEHVATSPAHRLGAPARRRRAAVVTATCRVLLVFLVAAAVAATVIRFLVVP